VSVFKGRALVTGGTRGIGRVIVRRLIEDGYFVEFTYLHSESAAAELEAEFPGKCRGRRVDSRKADEVQAYLADITAEEMPLTVLVNNAGITRDALVKDGAWEEFKETLEVNLGGTFHFARGLAPHMIKARHGDMIMISSLAARNVRAGNAFYGSSKAAIDRLSETLAVELARFNIAVNVIAPGFVETELTEELLDDKARRELLREIPLRRFTQADEVADAVLFLLSRKPLLVGATLPLGGGGHL
jgi:3-oxoacyl-[acyl-carrier protein] reductase